jgi:hypothetical protein
MRHCRTFGKKEDSSPAHFEVLLSRAITLQAATGRSPGNQKNRSNSISRESREAAPYFTSVQTVTMGRYMLDGLNTKTARPSKWARAGIWAKSRNFFKPFAPSASYGAKPINPLPIRAIDIGSGTGLMMTLKVRNKYWYMCRKRKARNIETKRIAD